MNWQETLPDVLAWVGGDEVAAAVKGAEKQRSALMWPRVGRATLRDPARPGGPRHVVRVGRVALAVIA